MRLQEEQQEKESELQRLRRELKEKDEHQEEQEKEKAKGDSKLKQLRQQLKCQTAVLDDSGEAVPGTPDWLRECRGTLHRGSIDPPASAPNPADEEERELNRLLQKYGQSDGSDPYVPSLAGTEGWHVQPAESLSPLPVPQPVSGRRSSQGRAPMVTESLTSESTFVPVYPDAPPRPAPASAPSGPQQPGEWAKIKPPTNANHTQSSLRIQTPRDAPTRADLPHCSSAGRDRAHALDPPTPTHLKKPADADRFDTIDKVAERNARFDVMMLYMC